MRLRLIGLLIAGSLFGAIFGWSSSAGAAAYTLSSSIAFNDAGTGVSGTIDPVFDLSGTTVCLNDTCGDTTTHDWFIVTITLDGGSNDVDEIGIAAIGEPAIGGGHFDDSGATPIGGSLSGGAELFDYGHAGENSDNLMAGATSDRLFAVFALGDLPGAGLPCCGIDPGTAQFMISLAGGTNFPVTGEGMIVLVPEPSTALLLGAGLAGLALASPRRSR